ncbi:hypothetical protein HYH03_009199 [Edaphochlamys debaryana]|uniref:FAS1 domain-containing protein n=1 Tax=Edaphochlamys debaryana TaxID=47281 RepID=A0A836BYR7_9CHLO|nr:hypothetical protein HYH03_009199 [Edaphochlamys debaryana]|eukprot:KAG2492534.1 hypothetical protein HYH03_009199 [Edaphochlamys debaryana]
MVQRQASQGRGRGCGAGGVAAAAAGAALGLVLLMQVAWLPGGSAQAYLPATMIDAMEAAMFLNRFMDAADVTGYYDRFLEPGFEGTVFAPVDLGFEALAKRSNATWDELTSPALNATLATIVGMHVVPGPRLFPQATLRDGMALTTSAPGIKIYVRRDVPGIVHVYGVPRPEDDPLNFATVLQYQEIRGGKAVLYVVDRVLTPPAKTPAATTATAVPTFTRRSRAGSAANPQK